MCGLYPPEKNLMKYFISAPCCLVLVLAVAGCGASKRDEYNIPEIKLPASYSNLSKAQAEKIRSDETAPMTIPQSISRWWMYYGNKELNSLVDEALANNYRLKAAIARIAQANALYGVNLAKELPRISSSAKNDISAPVYGLGSVKQGKEVQSERSYQIGMDVSYEVDLWGKNRAASEAALERAWSSVFARETVSLTLSADVTSNFIEYLSLSDRIKTAEITRDTIEGMLWAVGERLKGGEATSLQLAQQKSAVADAKAVIPILKLQRSQKVNAIALLLGKSPSEIKIKSKSLADIILPDVNPGVPSRLIMRRPDIRKSEADLIAADADIDAARAELLPSINLTGNYSYGSNYLKYLFTPESLIYSAAVSLTQIIFDAGKRENKIKLSEAKQAELVHNYMQTTYTALREVEDALVAIRFLALREKAQQESVDASQTAYKMSSILYKLGSIDYLTLLNTERTMLKAKDENLRIKFNQYRSTIDLFKSLGGGMEPDAVKIVEAKQDNYSYKDGNIRLADELPLIPENKPTIGLQTKNFWVHMAALWSEKAARRHWRRLRNQFPTMLGNLKPTIRREPVAENKGTWASLLLGPFKNRNDADGLCLALRNKGQGCQVIVR